MFHFGEKSSSAPKVENVEPIEGDLKVIDKLTSSLTASLRKSILVGLTAAAFTGALFGAKSGAFAQESASSTNVEDQLNYSEDDVTAAADNFESFVRLVIADEAEIEQALQVFRAALSRASTPEEKMQVVTKWRRALEVKQRELAESNAPVERFNFELDGFNGTFIVKGSQVIYRGGSTAEYNDEAAFDELVNIKQLERMNKEGVWNMSEVNRALTERVRILMAYRAGAEAARREGREDLAQTIESDRLAMETMLEQKYGDVLK